MNAAPSKWRVEQQAKSGLGTLMWLPVGESFADLAMAEAASARVSTRMGHATRVVSMTPPAPAR